MMKIVFCGNLIYGDKLPARDVMFTLKIYGFYYVQGNMSTKTKRVRTCTVS